MESLTESYLDLLPSEEIKQLTIFERNKPEGRLSSIDEDYIAEGLNELEVTDLNEFFKDRAVLERLEPIEKLIVYGKKDTVVDFELVKFARLAHLELYNLLFVNPNILKSFRLRHLVLYRVSHVMATNMSTAAIMRLEQQRQMPSEVFLSGLDDLQSENIRYLAIHRQMNIRAFNYLLERGLLSEIERLYITPADLSSLSHLSENYPTLKRIDLACVTSVLNELKSDPDLPRFLGELREDLSIFIGGMSLSIETSERIVNAVQNMNTKNEYTLEENSLIVREEFAVGDEPGDCGFRQLYLQLMHFDDARIREVNACGKIKFYLNSIPLTSKDYQAFDSFSDLREVTIKSFPDLAHEIFEDVVGRLRRHEKITYLAFELWNYYDFSFLFQLRELKQLSLRTSYPISQDAILEMLIELEHLEYVDLFFPKPDELTATACSEFKSFVEEQLAVSRFEPKGLRFTFKIIDFGTPLVRCQLKNEETMSEDSRLWSVEARKRMLLIKDRDLFYQII